jgi:hypothetical protein
MIISIFKLDHGLLGCEVVWSCKWLPSFLKNVSLHLQPWRWRWYKITRNYIPEDHNRHLHRLENLRSHISTRFNTELCHGYRRSVTNPKTDYLIWLYIIFLPFSRQKTIKSRQKYPTPTLLIFRKTYYLLHKPLKKEVRYQTRQKPFPSHRTQQWITTVSTSRHRTRTPQQHLHRGPQPCWRDGSVQPVPGDVRTEGAPLLDWRSRLPVPSSEARSICNYCFS